MVANCSQMAEMGGSNLLRASLWVNLIISCVSIPVLLKAAFYIRLKKLFHINTRIQIHVHIFGLILHCLGRLSLHIPDLLNYFSNFHNGCAILPNFYRCFYARGLYNIGISITEMCSISLVIERTIALIFNKSYENSSIMIGILLGFLQMFLAFCFLFNLYYYAPFAPSDNVVLYYCQTLASGTGSVWTINIPFYITTFAQIICRIVFQVLSEEHKKIRNENGFLTLSSRYSLDQGLRSITTLKQFVNVNTFIYVFLSVFATTLHLNSSMFSRPTYFAMVEMIHLFPTYGIMLSVFLYYMLKKMDRSTKCSLTDSIHANPDYYFKEFNKQLMK